MYTRDPNNKNQPLNLRPPNNYGGTAFRGGEVRLPADVPSVIVRAGSGEGSVAEREVLPEKIPQIKERSAPAGYSMPHTSFSPLKSAFPQPPGNDIPLNDINIAKPAEAAPAGLVFSGECDDGCPVGRTDARPPGNGSNPLKSLFSSIMPPGFGRKGKENEFGFEELLIVGLIFLLSQSQDDSDILLLLAMLLFF